MLKLARFRVLVQAGLSLGYGRNRGARRSWRGRWGLLRLNDVALNELRIIFDEVGSYFYVVLLR